jgi:hypothetical protein
MLTAALASQAWPADVNAFVSRDAQCNTPHRLDAAGRNHWACARLADDRDRLIRRYHGQPSIIEVLNGRWVITVRRVPMRP